MGNVVIKLNLPGINEVMKSPEILSAVEAAGQAVAGYAGADYAIKSGTINWIAYCNVYPDSKEAAQENFEDNTILKAASAVGLKLTK